MGWETEPSALHAWLLNLHARRPAGPHIPCPLQGTPEAPRCGFSRKVVEALQAAGEQFGSFDILADEAVRQGLKDFSNWPTYPQARPAGCGPAALHCRLARLNGAACTCNRARLLPAQDAKHCLPRLRLQVYVKGELLGGCDIILEMQVGF